MTYVDAVRIVNTAHPDGVSFFTKDGGAGWVSRLQELHSNTSLPRPGCSVQPNFREKVVHGEFWCILATSAPPSEGVSENEEHMTVVETEYLSNVHKKRKNEQHRFPLDPRFIGFENKDHRTCFAIVVVQLVFAIQEVRHFPQRIMSV